MVEFRCRSVRRFWYLTENDLIYLLSEIVRTGYGIDRQIRRFGVTS